MEPPSYILVMNDEFQWWNWTTFGIFIGSLAVAVAVSSLFSEPWRWLILGFIATAGGSFADARNRRRRNRDSAPDDGAV